MNVQDFIGAREPVEWYARMVSQDDYRLSLPTPYISRLAVDSDGAEGASFQQEQVAELGLTDAGGILQHCLEHRLQLTRRTADDLQHLGTRGLLLQRLLQVAPLGLHFVEQAGVLDRDHRLVGETFQEIDLALREGAFCRPH
jgi:hypothetical protein